MINPIIKELIYIPNNTVYIQVTEMLLDLLMIAILIGVI